MHSHGWSHGSEPNNERVNRTRTVHTRYLWCAAQTQWLWHKKLCAASALLLFNIMSADDSLRVISKFTRPFFPDDAHFCWAENIYIYWGKSFCFVSRRVGSWVMVACRGFRWSLRVLCGTRVRWAWIRSRCIHISHLGRRSPTSPFTRTWTD